MVYHRNFRDDLADGLRKMSNITYELLGLSEERIANDIRVNKLRVIRSESVFGQPADRFLVDIYAEAVVRITVSAKDHTSVENTYPVKTHLRLRYSLDLRPDKLKCRYLGTVINDNEGIYSLYPDGFRMDEYLLPVLKTQADYERMAGMIIRQDMPEYLDSDEWICGIEWIHKMGLGVYVGQFGKPGIMGEYFFGHGKARIYDPETERLNVEDVEPGTIILNMKLCDTRGKINSTATHEGVHYRLGYFFFMLQMTRGDHAAS